MGKLGDLSPQGSVAVGILVGLISTSLQAIGLTLQRKSHLLEDEKHPYDVRRPPYKRRRWQLGMGMFVISNIVGSTIQITTLPLPVLSTLQASGLVFNTIFATLILGEPFTRYSFAGTGLVCIGAVLIATFGAIGEPAHSLNQLLVLLQGRPFLIWMGMTLLIVASILLGSKLLRYFIPGSRGKPVAAGHFTPHLLRLQSRIKLARGMCYGAVSGILSAHSLLLAKSAVELLVRTLVDGKNQFNRWQSWVILLAMITLALTQLFYLHRGLKLCSTSVLYPFVFCVYNIIAILDGLIYFRQASQLAGFHAGLIALGTIILLVGVLCLSWRLEDIESHTAVTVVGPTQTGLGPGLGVVEEHSPSSSGLLDGLEDEESQLGEREPLLPGFSRSRQRPLHPRARAPSLPLLQTFDDHEAADLNAASIWAELDDSDYNFASTERPRSSSSGALHTPIRGLARHSTIGPISYQRVRGPHRSRPSQQESPWRRSSMPWASLVGSQRKRRAPLSSPTVQGANGYGTIPEDDIEHRDQGAPGAPDPSSTSSLLAGPRRTLRGAWNQGRQYLFRWTTSPAGDHSDSREHDRAYSSLLPRSETRLPWMDDAHNPSSEPAEPAEPASKGTSPSS
ncbi:Magnesium transporter NIPA [Penicillium longicatenatum]|uniref:Magnesium transporter NIPA n=1 Tax=Penicillium longicatenatum TaxID=1561947 RepID=UPI002547CF96|nr:Magnesium transporter NIPA [Penicillium longicatenatum]KAJ5657361.1 Magnesium transporter NIPA [Penicillium longicatenatum]